MIIDIGPYQAFVCHHPTDNPIHSPSLIDWVYRCCDFAIVGHVHQAWKTNWVKTKNFNFLNINVSVEVQKYVPIDDSEIIGIYEKCKRTLGK
jgi:calcineurin-like phosphoesterase family protein